MKSSTHVIRRERIRRPPRMPARTRASSASASPERSSAHGTSSLGAVSAMPYGHPGSPFPPIADYGFLSDCETCALIAPNGNVEWMCLPRFDSPSVFGAMLDRDAGGFRLGPAGVTVPGGVRYLPGTLVLETSWETRAGWVEVRDVLCIGPWYHKEERSHTHRRSPTNYDADHVLLRTVRCVQGWAEIHLDCEPVFDYGGLAAEWSYTGAGYSEATAGSEGMDLELRLVTDMNLGFEGPRARARTILREGEVAFAALGWSEHPLPTTYDEADERLVRTAHYWQEWLKQGTFPDHPWRNHLQRSALTLKGLSYAPTGAMVAAATTSLPETPGGERNWDYRYTWIRDSTFMLWALYTLGFDWEANDFFYFVADLAERPSEGRAADHVRDRRREPPGGAGARPSLRLRRCAAGADRQRRLPPAPARRVGRRAGLDLPAHPLARPAARPAVADHQAPGRRRPGALARTRPGDLGGPRRAQALHLLQAHVLGGGRPGDPPGAAARRPRVGAALAGGGRGDPRGRLRKRGRSSGGCSRSTTTRPRWTPRCS